MGPLIATQDVKELTPAPSEAAAHQNVHRTSLAALALAALGVVFGDIGTSPLYTLRECMHAAGGTKAGVDDLFGILSLMFWALVMVVTVKYLTFVMRADHGGEGGIFALLAIVPERFRTHAVQSGKVTGMALLAVIGASLLYGDGVITPAISVLSAVEGLAVASPRLSPAGAADHVRDPGGAVFDSAARDREGRQALWSCDGGLVRDDGCAGRVSSRPGAADPRGTLSASWGCFLPPPWGARHADPRVSRPCRDGRGSLVRGHGPFRGPAHSPDVDVLRAACARARLPRPGCTDPCAIPRRWRTPSTRMVPAGLPTYLLVLLSSAATVIASQALISGAFSLTRQAMLLGYLPRVTIKHTAYHTEGQIYIPEVNNLLAIGCLALVLTFRESVRLAAAYGIAVTGTMAITSILYYIVVRHSWGWSKWKAGALLALFLSFDIPFLVANLFKFFEGGYVPMLIGAALDRRHADLEPRPDGPDGAIHGPVLEPREGPTLDRALALLAGARQCCLPRAQRRPRPPGSHAPRRAQPLAA